MKVRLSAGAELDLLSPAELHDELEAFHRQLLADNEGRMPRRTSAVDTADANGVVILDLGNPDPRREWELRSLALLTRSVNGVKAAQNAYLFIGSQVPSHPDLGPSGAANLTPYAEWVHDVFQNLGVPWAFTYTGNAHVARPDEHVFVVIAGTATVGEVYVATASVLDGAYKLRPAREART